MFILKCQICGKDIYPDGGFNYHRYKRIGEITCLECNMYTHKIMINHLLRVIKDHPVFSAKSINNKIIITSKEKIWISVKDKSVRPDHL